MALCAIGRGAAGLVHHSDRGVQYLASVGSKGDSYDNALAETVNGLYKAELLHRRGPWHTVEQVELATAEWVAWWNRGRLHSACHDVPSAEFEAAYWQRQEAPIVVA